MDIEGGINKEVVDKQKDNNIDVDLSKKDCSTSCNNNLTKLAVQASH